MTVEDRLRATTEAIAEAMRPLPPLDLSPGAGRRAAPAGRWRPRLRGGWHGRLIPIAAAVAVIVVAATLVLVRNLPGAKPGPRPAPASSASSAAPGGGFPRYYVAFSSAGTYFDNRTARTATLGETATGKRLATFTAPPGSVFTQVAGSASGEDFVLFATPGPAGSPAAAKGADSWYSLRLAPGASGPPRLTRIPLAVPAFDPGSVAVKGLAVSPGGGTLAVLTQAVTGNVPKVPAGPVTLRTYSLATGRPLRSWAAPAGTEHSASFSGLTWLADGRTVGFAVTGHDIPPGVRTLNTGAPGAGLLAGSRLVFRMPGSVTCLAGLLLAADGKAVVCGSEPLGPRDRPALHDQVVQPRVARGRARRGERGQVRGAARLDAAGRPLLPLRPGLLTGLPLRGRLQ